MPRYNNARKTYRYTEEFKAKAVQLSHLDGVQVQQIADSLGVHPFMLSRWRKEYREGRIVADRRKRVTSSHKGVSDSKNVRDLEQEVSRLKTENELLKKALHQFVWVATHAGFPDRDRDHRDGSR